MQLPIIAGDTNLSPCATFGVKNDKRTAIITETGVLRTLAICGAKHVVSNAAHRRVGYQQVASQPAVARLDIAEVLLK